MTIIYEVVKMMFDYRIIETDGLLVFNNWCYETKDQADSGLEDMEFDAVEPEGWFRHVETGRRRPDGNPDKEYISS